MDKDLFGKSVDYAIFDKDKNEIICCIELDGPEHEIDSSRIEIEAKDENVLNKIKEMYNSEDIVSLRYIFASHKL